MKRPVLVAFAVIGMLLVGMCGWFVAAVVGHVWQDHASIHTLHDTVPKADFDALLSEHNVMKNIVISLQKKAAGQ